METTPELPPVEAVRVRKTFRRPPTHHSYSLLEGLQYYTGTDPDLIWGPFYERFRVARWERTDWVNFSLGAIWNGIPATAQTRPGKIARAWNWVQGVDPAPTIAHAGRRGRKSTPAIPGSAAKLSAGTRSWQDEVGLREDWSPSRVDFTEWYGRERHPVDYNDEYFRTTYRALYDRLCEFGETWFGAGVHLEDWRDSVDEASVWEVPMTDQFVEYAKNVAHEDRGYVNWRDILDDPSHRKWLCIGIFSQIIQRHIFDQLLFGATKGIKGELERHDMRWIEEEGMFGKRTPFFPSFPLSLSPWTTQHWFPFLRVLT